MVVCAAFGCLCATSGEAAAPASLRVVGVVSSREGQRLRLLDARTLKPVRGGWVSRVIDGETRPALSPSGARVVFAAPNGGLVVLDTTTGRVVRTYGKWAQGGERLYWLGGEGTERDPEVMVAHINCGARNLCSGQEFNIIDRRDPAYIVFPGWPTTALREGLVIQYHLRGPKRFVVYGPEFDQGGNTEIVLGRMLPSAPFRVVPDVAHSRLFAISSAGLVAEIDRIGDLRRRERVRYHPVELNGRYFDAAWAGAGKLALWGNDGLGTIDTRTWKTHHIAPNVVGAVATPFGIAAWGDPAGGVTVYRSDGRMRLRVLVGTRVGAADAVGGYLYVNPGDWGSEYSVDLRTGNVVGPLRATNVVLGVLQPDLVAIP
jgi:hypothetical protein